MNTDNDPIAIIREKTRSIFPDSQILLFGSRARNDNDNESDYDFLILTKDSIEATKKRILKSQLRKELAKHKIPADVLVQSLAEFQLYKEIKGHILREVMKEGVSL
jgi:predicted nucleotidyltransferase